MGIITLTSDYGANTYYAAGLKAKLYALLPEIVLVDISHNLPCYDLVQAAFLVKSCMDDFEHETVHLIAVDTSLILYNEILIAKSGNNWVICADNGFLSMMDETWDEVYVVKKELYDVADLSPEKNIFTKLAARIFNKSPISDFAQKGTPRVVVDSLRPVVESLQIRASIVHVDGYDNAVSNLNKKQFEQWLGESQYRIYYKRKEFLEQVETNYAKVSAGMGVAVFNDKGWLEIAINRGKGKSLLGLKLGDQVIIEKQI
ncbi:MAG: SAM-dependent chlorinase/fluorinase [Bacteroidota bacterium]